MSFEKAHLAAIDELRLRQEQLFLALEVYVVLPGLETELDHKIAIAIADKNTTGEILTQSQRRRCLAHIRHHHVTGPRQVDVVRRVLGAPLVSTVCASVS